MQVLSCSFRMKTCRLPRAASWKPPALDAIDLLERVAIFKGVYFKAARANYEEARPGTLRLMPSQQIIAPLREDYARMEPMFFGEPPPLEDILACLPELEDRINGSNR